MAKVNALNNVAEELTIDPGASGDSFVQFDINATGEFRIGVDDDASDAFKISQGSALGTNDTFVMTAAGERTMPLQPAFMARLLSDESNVTGDGTVATVGVATAWTEIYDQGADFNTNGTFTAPVTARYSFEATALIDDTISSHTAGLGILNASNRDVKFEFNNPFAVGWETGAFYTYAGSCSIDMDAADTMIFQVQVSNGTKVIDVRGDASGQWTSFSGWLSV